VHWRASSLDANLRKDYLVAFVGTADKFTSMNGFIVHMYSALHH
jgi:hypothetical protein